MTSLNPSMAAEWLPNSGVHMVRCGEHFDAVGVPLPLAEHVIELLGERSGPVIECDPEHTLYWLVAPGSGNRWRFPAVEGVKVLADACHIHIPAATPEPYSWTRWRTPPRGACLTSAHALHKAIRQAYAGLTSATVKDTR